jgi:hypothetical protein
MSTAVKLQAAQTQALAESREQIDAARNEGKQFDASALIAKMRELGVHDEAGAFLQGWNNVVDAAAQETHSALSAQQLADLLLNLRYRAPFLIAIKSSGAQRLAGDAHGMYPLDEHNLSVMSDALGRSQVIDVR